MVLELSEVEASQLARCLDATVKAEGIQAAVAIVPLFKKLQEAANKEKQPALVGDMRNPGA